MEAAARVGMGESTLRRWLTDDTAFQAEFEAARQATFQAAISRIPAFTARAVDTLAALLGDKEPPAVRLGAARAVTEHWAASTRRRNDPAEAGRDRSPSAEVEVCAPLERFAARVERLASVCLPSPAPLVIFHEQCHHGRARPAAPSLRAHARRWRRPARIATCGA